MASASIKDVKRRIKSVESTRQITKAMELVASSKLRKAKERALAAQPYYHTMYETMCEISKVSSFTSIYTKKAFIKTSLLVVIAGDRGLAGGFNHNVFKLAEQKIGELESDGGRVIVFPIGKKACEYFEKRNREILNSVMQISEDITPAGAFEIASIILSGFRERKYDRVDLIFTTFVSSLSQEPLCAKILPIEDMTEDNGSGEEKAEKKNLTLYEPSPEEVFDGLIPNYLSGLMFCAVVDSYASEQAARRTAMESASDNADEMIESLSLLYNRARQDQITQELNEIVSGSLGKK